MFEQKSVLIGINVQVRGEILRQASCKRPVIERSIHAADVVVGQKLAEHFNFAVDVANGNGWVRNAVEHGGFHGGVVNHILEHNAVANLQLAVETPLAHKVATEATVATHAVSWQIGLRFFCPQNGWFVRHFEAIGHVARKRHIEQSGLCAVVFDYVLNGRNQHASSPRERTAGFQNDVQMRIFFLEIGEQID